MAVFQPDNSRGHSPVPRYWDKLCERLPGALERRAFITGRSWLVVIPILVIAAVALVRSLAKEHNLGYPLRV
jgi:hypothetical protein